jgi:hypothetical protein
VSATERDKVFDGPYDSIVIPDGHWLHYALRGQRGVSVHVRLDYHPSSFDYLHLPQALGLTNPLSIAYEVTPFSFLADWFIPIGDFLSILDATLGFAFLSGSYTTRRFRDFSCNFAPEYVVTDSGVKYFCSGNAGGWYSGMELIRTPYASSPIPGPRFKNPLSLGHMANGLSLLATVAEGSRLSGLKQSGHPMFRLNQKVGGKAWRTNYTG